MFYPLLRVLGLLAVAVLALGACAAQPESLKTVRVTFPAKDAHYAPYFIAIEKGYYAEEGIQLEMVEAAGNVGVAAVLAGDAELTTSAGVALSAILKGGAMKVVYSHMDRPNYELWSSQPEIRTLGDLQGKPVGVIGRGDSMEISTRLVLMRSGLDPNGVAYTALGPGPARLAAVQSGAVAAAVLSLTDVQELMRANPKGNRLADVSKDVRMLFNGAATSDQLLANDPDLVTKFMRATVKGREYFRRFKDQTLDITGKYNGRPREANEVDYLSVLATMTPDGALPEDAQAADAQVRAALVGADTVRPIGEVYDYSIVRGVGDELKRSGWQPRA